MPPRRSHNKSRRGCLACKSAHIKCDEEGPPCGRCKLRGTPCEYGAAGTVSTSTSNCSAGVHQGQEGNSLPMRRPLGSGPRDGSTLGNRTRIRPGSHPTQQEPTSNGNVNGVGTKETTPNDIPSFPTNLRLLELQLMHRWATVTYKSMCTPAAADDYVWLVKLPSWSVEHEEFGFLLEGLLALTAFEVASGLISQDENKVAERDGERTETEIEDRQDERERHRRKQQGEKYVQAAVEYQTSALGLFRRHLEIEHDQKIDNDQIPSSDIDSHAYEPVLAFSMVLMVLAFASAQFLPDEHIDLPTPPGSSASMVANTLTHYELIRGCVAVMGPNADAYLSANPYTGKLTLFEDLPVLPLNSTAAITIAKLRRANERRLTSAGVLSESYTVRVQHVAAFEACNKAISFLNECFAKCSGNANVERADWDGYEGYTLGWLNLAGDEYVQAIRNSDKVALLVLMVWGALVEHLGSHVWWAKRFGGLLMEEIAAQVGRDENGVVDELAVETVKLAREIARGA